MADPNPSSLVTNGAIVSDANPLPCTVSAITLSGVDIALNPRGLIVNGAPVSDDNPLPITLE